MLHLTRRQVLQGAGAGLATLALARLDVLHAEDKADAPKGFTLPPLPYDYDALEPHIDKKTMQIHHDKHHAAYVANLNEALKDHPEFLKLSLPDLLSTLGKGPKDIRTKVNNNAGGHANHSRFW